MKYSIAIVGATGAVGQEMLRVLEKRNFPIKQLRCFASPRSLGKKVLFKGEEIAIEVLEENSFEGIDIALFSAGRAISKEFAPKAVQAGAVVVDNSSCFRKDPDVPLVIPEINPHAVKRHRGIISCPNCTTIIMLMALAPLHHSSPIKRIVATTYQAASGAGQTAMEELALETSAHLSNHSFNRTVMPFPYAFNLFLHNSPMTESGYVEEELKMLYETHKILENTHIRISATCVRVPIFRAHSISLNVEFMDALTKRKAYELLHLAKGVTVLENWAENRFPMPIDATGEDNVLCGRIREDHSQPHTLELWVVGDQILKGAALNSVQIAEEIIKLERN
jgi:aspartate-semialdehyde dehydrogenase